MSIKMVPVPSFKDFFDEEMPVLEDILKELSVDEALIRFSIYLAEIERNGEEEAVQFKIWQDILNEFPSESKRRVEQHLFNRKNRKDNQFIQIFSKYYIIEFIQTLLRNYTGKSKNDTSLENSTTLLKVYLISVDRVQKNDEKKYDFNRPTNFEIADDKLDLIFQQMTWPIMLKQHSISRKVDAKFESVKFLLIFQFFESTYPDFLANYLKEFSVNSYFQIYVVLAECIRYVSRSELNQGGLSFPNPILINIAEDIKKILEPLVLDLEDLQLNTENYKSELKFNDYLLLREKPILKLKNYESGVDFLLVLSTEFFKDKLYRSVIFDFYNKSGISTKFKTLPDLLNEKASLFTEKILFKLLILNSFKRNYSPVIFDENQISGMADCYIRIGKYILLLELKDSLMPAKPIESGHFEQIKTDISTKFFENRRGKDKGIKQILNNIYRLNEKPFEFDRFDKNGIKTKNIVIIPVVVYTDCNYSMIGIQDFLRKEFEKSIEEENVKNLGRIEDLILVNLETFYSIIVRKLEQNILQYFLKFNQRIRKKNKDFKRNKNFENEVKTYETIEEYLSSTMNANAEKLSFKSIIKILNIKVNP